MFYYNHCQRKLGRNSVLIILLSLSTPYHQIICISYGNVWLEAENKQVIGSFSNHNRSLSPNVKFLLWNPSFMMLQSHISPFPSSELHSDFHQQLDQDQEYHHHLGVHSWLCHGSQPLLYLLCSYHHSFDWCTQQTELELYYGELTQCWELVKQSL